MADWTAFFQGLSNAANTISRTLEFRKIIALPRDTGMQVISHFVNTAQTWEAVDAFQRDFVNFTLSLFDENERVRAMELYAWHKVVETAANQEPFRGFHGAPGALS